MSLYTRYLLLLAASLSFQSASYAQSTPVIRNLRGQLQTESRDLLDHLTIELAQSGRPSEKAPVSIDGSFEMRDINEGLYELRVLNRHGEVVRSEHRFVREHEGPLAIRMPASKSYAGTAAMVSVKYLNHQVPSKARKALLQSQKSGKKGDRAAELQFLERAVEIDPDYMEAQNNLGVRYMNLGNYERALPAFTKAAELNAGDAQVLANLGLVLVALQRYAEAETASKKALLLAPEMPQAQYALGLSLAGKGGCPATAVDLLTSVGTRYPRARLAAAYQQVCRGDISGAREQLRAYLATPNTDRRTDVQKWLASLESASPASARE